MNNFMKILQKLKAVVLLQLLCYNIIFISSIKFILIYITISFVYVFFFVS